VLDHDELDATLHKLGSRACPRAILRLASIGATDSRGETTMINECNFVPTIPTKDMAASRRFYEEVLGLPIDTEDPEMGVWYRVPSGIVYLYESEFAGTAKHTLVSLESEHIDEDIQELRDRGVTFETYDLPGVEWEGDVASMGDKVRGVWFRDPAGNILAMFQKARVLAHT
jgi:catechol 2,3-dioxygenase-like lactoylglutathione lyase family enzyme